MPSSRIASICPTCGHRTIKLRPKAPDRILAVFLRERGRIVAPAILAKEADCTVNTVKNMISVLRREGHHIVPERGQGYRYLGKVSNG